MAKVNCIFLHLLYSLDNCRAYHTPIFQYRAQLNGSAYCQILRLPCKHRMPKVELGLGLLSHGRVKTMFLFFLNSFNVYVEGECVECLVLLSTHAHKPKFAAYHEICLPCKHRIPCFRKRRFCAYGKQSHEIGHRAVE